MRIVLATSELDGVGGSETYVITVADHLQRLGHDVWLHALQCGTAAEHARGLGLRVAERPEQLPGEPEALVVQDGTVATLLAERYPGVPQAFVAHSDIFDLQLPLALPGLTAAVVTLYDRVDRRVRAHASEARVVRLSQPIDVERFKPRGTLPQRPRVALTFGNYVHGSRLQLLRDACEQAGIELRHVGGGGGRTTDPAGALNDADIVFGKARAVLEAMACGRAVYVFDHNGAEGWVTDANRARLAADNFGGQSEPIAVDAARLAEDLRRYDPASGLSNRDWVVSRHAATKHAAALAGVLREIAASPPPPPPADAPLRELARLVRLHHRADAQAFMLHADLERRERRIGELQHELDELRLAEQAAQAAAHEARAAAADAEARARSEAEAAEVARAQAGAADARAAALVTTRRWRVVQGLMAPADLLRAPGRIRAARARSAAPAGAPAPAAPAAAAPAAAAPAPTAPAAAAAAPDPPPPAPFVVGVARSGTTLLRLQLDAHPLLAIPPETGFGFAAEALQATGDRAAFAAALTEVETWPDLGIEPAALDALLAAVEPWSPAEGLRAVYRAYGARHGKPRWGDKTPGHARHLVAIEALLPEARFVHLIRDGRDVAASLREQPFAPGDGGIEAVAAHWREELLAARAAGARVAHYHEVRYERLLAEPEATLREICDFAELPFSPAMLSAHERAAARLAELPDARPDADGRVVTRAQRVERHARTATPPDRSRAGRWRTSLSDEEVATVERVAGDLLAELGYTEVHA